MFVEDATKRLLKFEKKKVTQKLQFKKIYMRKVYRIMKANKSVTNEQNHPTEVLRYSSEVPTPIVGQGLNH